MTIILVTSQRDVILHPRNLALEDETLFGTIYRVFNIRGNWSLTMSPWWSLKLRCLLYVWHPDTKVTPVFESPISQEDQTELHLILFRLPFGTKPLKQLQNQKRFNRTTFENIIIWDTRTNLERTHIWTSTPIVRPNSATSMRRPVRSWYTNTGLEVSWSDMCCFNSLEYPIDCLSHHVTPTLVMIHQHFLSWIAASEYAICLSLWQRHREKHPMGRRKLMRRWRMMENAQCLQDQTHFAPMFLTFPLNHFESQFFDVRDPRICCLFSQRFVHDDRVQSGTA